jgi:hypothetical protein
LTGVEGLTGVMKVAPPRGAGPVALGLTGWTGPVTVALEGSPAFTLPGVVYTPPAAPSHGTSVQPPRMTVLPQ